MFILKALSIYFFSFERLEIMEFNPAYLQRKSESQDIKWFALVYISGTDRIRINICVSCLPGQLILFLSYHAEVIGVPEDKWSGLAFLSNCQDSEWSMQNHRIQKPVLANSIAAQDWRCDLSILCNKKRLLKKKFWGDVIYSVTENNDTEYKCKSKIQNSLFMF